MAKYQSDLLRLLDERGYVHQMTDAEGLDALAARQIVPGYIGFDQGGLLTDAIRKQPYTVLLLDEIEKAHPDLFSILLQVMDHATLTDNNGKKADFRNVVLLMTSNAGAFEMSRPSVGFGSQSGSPDEASHRALKAVENLFTPDAVARSVSSARTGTVAFLPEPMA